VPVPTHEQKQKKKKNTKQNAVLFDKLGCHMGSVSLLETAADEKKYS